MKEKLSKAAIAKAKAEWGAFEDTTPRRKDFKINRQNTVKLPTVREVLEKKQDRSPATQKKREVEFVKNLKNGKTTNKTATKSMIEPKPAKKVKAKKKKIQNTATPAAQKLADKHGIIISELDGGIDNRISVGEVKAAIKAIKAIKGE